MLKHSHYFKSTFTGRYTLRSKILFLVGVALFLGANPVARAESQESSEYKGITDPFGDPSNYEFAEEEKEDKEFFHLGRYLQMGVDIGAAILTGGLGNTTSPGFNIGVRLIYYFDKILALELGAHYSNHLDTIQPTTSQAANIDTNIIPLTIGFRYCFDTKDAPKAIALANPYLVAGVGSYFRMQNVLSNNLGVSLNSNTTTANFGAFAGAGLEFGIYKKHLFLGFDGRFNYVIWNDQDDTFGGVLPPGSRAGGYVTTSLTLTYNF